MEGQIEIVKFFNYYFDIISTAYQVTVKVWSPRLNWKYKNIGKFQLHPVINH